MQNLGCKIKKTILVTITVLFFPFSGICEPVSFLPMEDSMSAARTVSEFTNDNIKPYRQSFSLKTEDASSKSLLNFSSTDICAFILLAGIYIMLTKKSTATRNNGF
ncbi:MAG: hypothetical protein E6772_00625 [Dysgonomonas sp.]|nr:hypothetical protein [Dysgonomonas sp.]